MENPVLSLVIVLKDSASVKMGTLELNAASKHVLMLAIIMEYVIKALVNVIKTTMDQTVD